MYSKHYTLYQLTFLFRKERKDRSGDKDRPKRSREDASEDERARYSSRANKIPGAHRTSFRHDQQTERHVDHERWGSSRFGSEHNEYKREHGYEYKHYEHQRASGYHRDREHSRPDKRCLFNALCVFTV